MFTRPGSVSDSTWMRDYKPDDRAKLEFAEAEREK